MDQSSRKYNGWRRMALAVVVTVLLGNHLWFPQSVAQAAGLAQSGTTGNAQCMQGMVALLGGRLIEARQTLSAGITNLQQTTVPNRQTLGLCALFLGIAHHSAYELNDAQHAYTVAQQAFDQTTDEQMRWVATFALGKSLWVFSLPYPPQNSVEALSG